MKIGFIGCVDFSLAALTLLTGMIEQGIEVCGVVTKEKSKFNADHVDLSQLCRDKDIPSCYYRNDNDMILEFFNELRPDVIYCFGWSHLLPGSLLSLPPKGVIGFHPAALPQNRGRHPIIWALALGLKQTASTFFVMDEGADSGALVSQVELEITGQDNAASLYEKITVAALPQIEQFTLAFNDGSACVTEQDHQQATYWRKRSRKDGLIDWRMNASDIHNLIRALSKPYPGAEFNFNQDTVVVFDSRLHEQPLPENVECGRVMEASNGTFLIKCAGQSGIWIEAQQLINQLHRGDYL